MKRSIVLTLCFGCLVLLTNINICYSGLYFDEQYNNVRYKHDFNTSDDLIYNATSITTLKLANDPTPYIGQFLNGTMVIVDPGFNRLIWNHYNPQNEKYGIRDMYQTMIYPRSIAADSDGFIYVTDVYDYKVVKYSVDISGDGHRLQHVTSFGEIGSGDAQFVDPFHIEITKNNSDLTRVYVSDLSRQDIQMFDSEGNFILKIGEVGSGDGQFNTPRGMAAQGNVLYVADTGNGRIQQFTVTDTGYQYVSSFYCGDAIPGDALFTDVALVNGGIYIVDENHNQIYLVTQDFKYVKTYCGNPGDPFQDLKSIAVVPSIPGNYSSYQAITVEKKRIQSFRLGMEIVNLSAEPSYFYPLASENNTTSLKYTLTESGFVQMRVRDSNKIVRTLLVDQLRSFGKNEEVWDGRDDQGNICPGGRYYFDMSARDTNGNGVAVKWDYTVFPVKIHEAPIVTIQSVSPAVIATGTNAIVNFTLSKSGNVQMEVLDQNSVVVNTINTTGVVGNNTIAWSGTGTPGPVDGYYTLRIKAQDSEGYWSSPKDIQVALANAPPVVSLDMPSNNTYGLNASISGSVAGFLLASYKIEYQKVGNTGWGLLHDTSVSSDTSGELFIWDTALIEKSEAISYNLRLTALNQAGVGSPPVLMTVLVDNIPPRINALSLSPNFISPAVAATGSPQTQTTFSLQIDETNHHENKIIVIDKLSTTRNELALTNDSATQNATWNGSDYNGFAIEDGMVTCRLSATDAGGNVTTKDVQLVLDANRYPETITIESTTQILGETDSNYRVCWTPDGEKIVYVERSNDMSNVYMKNADGTGTTQQLTYFNTGLHVTMPDISPDGRKLVCSAPDGGDQLYFTNIIGSNFLPSDLYGFHGRWSPDNEKIAYVNVDGRIEMKYLSSSSAKDFEIGLNPCWSPDSKWIYYSDDIDPYTSQIYKVNIETEQIVGPITQGLYPEISSDDNLMAFQSGPFLIKVKDNTDAINTLVDNNFRRMAVWSPDVSKIAYVNIEGQTFVSELDRPDQYANLTAILNMPLEGEVDITGSAADLNFEGYTLSYSTAEDAVSWTTLSSSAMQVKNSALGEWDTSSLAPGEYWLKLEVWDKAQNRKIVMRKVNITNLGPNLIFDVHADPSVVLPDVAGQETTTIYYTLHDSVTNIEMTVYDKNNVAIKTLSPAQNSGSTYPVTLSAAWDATDDSNNPVAEGIYTFILTAQGAGATIQKQGTVSVTTGQPTAIFSSPVLNSTQNGHVVFEGTASGYDFDEYVITVAGAGSGMISATEIVRNDIPVDGNVLGEWDAPEDGPYFASLVVRNQLGVESSSALIINIDATAPISQFAVQGDTVEAASKIYCGPGHSISLTAADEGRTPIGVKEIQVAIDGNWQVYAAPIQIIEPGEHTIQYYAVDLLDNQEETHSAIVVVNDLTPTTSATIQGTQYQPGTLIYLDSESNVTLESFEQGSTAVDVAQIQWAIESPQASAPYLIKMFQTYDQAFTLSGVTDAEMGIYFRGIDQTGNEESWKQIGPVYADTIAPETTITAEGPAIVIGPNNQQFATSATMYLFSATDQGSGVNHTEYKIIHESSSGEWFGYIPGEKVILTNEGFTEAYYRSYDNVGNSEVAQSGNVIIDNTQPTIEAIMPLKDGVYTPPVNPSITISDDYLKETIWSLDGTDYTPGTPIMTLGNHVLEIMAVDWAGNSRYATIPFVVAEATPTFTPTVSLTPTVTQSLTETQTWTVTQTLTHTPTVTLTGTPTLSVTQTNSPTMSVTPTPTRTRTITTTSTVTSTATRTHSPTMSETPTSTHTRTITLTWSATPTVTQTSSPTMSVTSTATQTDTPTGTFTHTATRTITETTTPTPTQSGTATPSVTITPSVTPTVTPTITNTATRTATLTATPTPSFTTTVTSTLTHTSTATPTRTGSITATNTLTYTQTSTPTVTSSATSSITMTDTPTLTVTITPTMTMTPVGSVTVVPTKTPTPQTPQRIRAWVNGCFIMQPGESREIFAESIYRRVSQPDIPIRFKVILGQGSFEQGRMQIENTGPDAEPAKVIYSSPEKLKRDIVILRVDNMGLGGKRYVVLLVVPKGRHQKGVHGATVDGKMMDAFDSQSQALQAAEEIMASIVVIDSPTPTVSSTATPTSSQTPMPQATNTVIPTTTNTPIVYSVKASSMLAYPNPGREYVRFAVKLEESARVTLEIYNMLGEKVAVIQEHKSVAPYGTFVEWKTNQAAPGFYICRMTVRGDSGKINFVKTCKVAIIK